MLAMRFPLRRNRSSARRQPGRYVASAAVGALGLTLLGAPASQANPATGPAAQTTRAREAVRVLVFHGATGGDAVAAGVNAIKAVGAQGADWQKFDVVATPDATAFTAENLRDYNAVVFLGTTGDVLDGAQEAAFQEFIRAGGGFVGISDAARVEPDSEWFTQLVGARPGTSPDEVQEAVVEVGDRVHPATKVLPVEWKRSDKWLNWATNPSGSVHTVASVRETSYQPGTGANGADHPISWCRDYDGGRSFYTGMGHTAQSFRDADFRNHLFGALLWTTRLVRADCKATIAANYKATRLTQPNQSGQLDQIGEPHGLAIAGDGRVFYIGRGGPMTGGPAPITDWNNPDIGKGQGTIHLWHPRTQKVSLVATLDVFGNKGGGDELTKSEEGLLGIALDPKFAENGWVYLHYTPHSQINRDTHMGQRRVSRFTLNHETNTLDLTSEKVLLKWDVQIHSCCHVGGDMVFDSKGNLYIATGDTNSSGFSDGYSGNNPAPNFKGVSFADARRTAGNTNDLNGKILRIKPNDDGTYAVPEGNLFNPGAPQADKTRPEIYVMGMRNPSRLWVDQKTDNLYVGWVGPDAGAPSTTWGPAKYDQFAVITKAGNHGWPYCVGNKQPYRDRNLPDPTKPLGWYDCDNLRNDSPNNTGRRNIPPARGNNIWYSPQGGGPDYPRYDGVPTYKAGDERFLLPWLKGGGQAAMNGPVYRFDKNNPSQTKWPQYWDGMWFVGDFYNGDQPRHAVLMDPATAGQGGLPVHAENLKKIVPASNDAIRRLMAWRFGPDGALYVLNYGNGFFNADAASALWRVQYVGGEATPAPEELVPGVPGYKRAEKLFDGSKYWFSRWEHVGAGGFTLNADGSMTSKAEPGLGMLWFPAKEYKDFSLKLQWRDDAPGEGRANSGVFVRFPWLYGHPNESRPEWVAIKYGHELQILDRTDGDQYKSGSVYGFDLVSLADANVTPKGTWNDYEIRVVGQHYSIYRNGKLLNEFVNAPGQLFSPPRADDPGTSGRQHPSGFIGLQNHGTGDVISFRNIRITQL
ncbi:Glucose / Sorbosone dehydrogenase [Micromonospora pattaloongensis]|uniref:Glucose / Sorbosone dehydrogenase n=2 Tax=Micromonospora pattaloongensis TaxID=405436 RepID=A0A1H3NKZ5_9ACTN|nr:Glucose / Sorbosone dehydrogenase [Micromonospora pattaloongensis]